MVSTQHIKSTRNMSATGARGVKELKEAIKDGLCLQKISKLFSCFQ